MTIIVSNHVDMNFMCVDNSKMPPYLDGESSNAWEMYVHQVVSFVSISKNDYLLYRDKNNDCSKIS